MYSDINFCFFAIAWAKQIFCSCWCGSVLLLRSFLHSAHLLKTVPTRSVLSWKRPPYFRSWTVSDSYCWRGFSCVLMHGLDRHWHWVSSCMVRAPWDALGWPPVLGYSHTRAHTNTHTQHHLHAPHTNTRPPGNHLSVLHTANATLHSTAHSKTHVWRESSSARWR